MKLKEKKKLAELVGIKTTQFRNNNHLIITDEVGYFDWEDLQFYSPETDHKQYIEVLKTLNFVDNQEVIKRMADKFGEVRTLFMLDMHIWLSENKEKIMDIVLEVLDIN